MINEKSSQNIAIKNNSLDHESTVLTWTLVVLIVVFSAFLVMSYKPDAQPLAGHAGTTTAMTPMGSSSATTLSPSNVVR